MATSHWLSLMKRLKSCFLSQIGGSCKQSAAKFIHIPAISCFCLFHHYFEFGGEIRSFIEGVQLLQGWLTTVLVRLDLGVKIANEEETPMSRRPQTGINLTKMWNRKQGPGSKGQA